MIFLEEFTDQMCAEEICAHFITQHQITVQGLPRGEYHKELSALHISLHRFNGNLRKACEEVGRLFEEG
jgi:hypothetical protein